MDLDKAIKNRRSVRSYKSTPITESDLKQIIEAGRWAPSSGNTQPLELVVTENEKEKKKIAKAANNQSFISEAPVVIVACANVPRTQKRYGERGKNMYIFQDTAAAIQNMLLKAYSLGYGSCWIGSFQNEKVENIIDAPEEIKAVAIVTFGIPEETPSTPNKRSSEEITHRNSFEKKDN